MPNVINIMSIMILSIFDVTNVKWFKKSFKNESLNNDVKYLSIVLPKYDIEVIMKIENTKTAHNSIIIL